MKICTMSFIVVLLLLQACNTKEVAVPTVSMKQDTNQSIKEINTLIRNTTDDEENSGDDFDDEYSEYSENESEVKDDPFESYNRLMTTFNDQLFIYMIDPISEGYNYIFPEAIRIGLSNAIHNIKFPIRFTNNLLQGKMHNSLEETERFLVNSTVGIAGLFDPAKNYFNLSAHNEDFGQTLGYYGVGAGYHVVLPFLGPSNIRDMVGLTVDGYMSPFIYQNSLAKYKIPQNNLESIGIYSLEMLNKNALNMGAYESLKKDAIDLYPFLRDIYEQKRISDITN